MKPLVLFPYIVLCCSASKKAPLEKTAIDNISEIFLEILKDRIPDAGNTASKSNHINSLITFKEIIEEIEETSGTLTDYNMTLKKIASVLINVLENVPRNQFLIPFQSIFDFSVPRCFYYYFGISEHMLESLSSLSSLPRLQSILKSMSVEHFLEIVCFDWESVYGNEKVSIEEKRFQFIQAISVFYEEYDGEQFYNQLIEALGSDISGTVPYDKNSLQSSNHPTFHDCVTFLGRISLLELADLNVSNGISFAKFQSVIFWYTGDKELLKRALSPVFENDAARLFRAIAYIESMDWRSHVIKNKFIANFIAANPHRPNLSLRSSIIESAYQISDPDADFEIDFASNVDSELYKDYRSVHEAISDLSFLNLELLPIFDSLEEMEIICEEKDLNVKSVQAIQSLHANAYRSHVVYLFVGIFEQTENHNNTFEEGHLLSKLRSFAHKYSNQFEAIANYFTLFPFDGSHQYIQDLKDVSELYLENFKND